MVVSVPFLVFPVPIIDFQDHGAHFSKILNKQTRVYDPRTRAYGPRTRDYILNSIFEKCGKIIGKKILVIFPDFWKITGIKFILYSY